MYLIMDIIYLIMYLIYSIFPQLDELTFREDVFQVAVEPPAERPDGHFLLPIRLHRIKPSADPILHLVFGVLTQHFRDGQIRRK